MTAYSSKVFLEIVNSEMSGKAASVSKEKIGVVVSMARNGASILPVYEVDADKETGEWLGEPSDTGETAIAYEWMSLSDEDAYHDHAEHDGKDILVLVNYVE